MDVKQHSTSTLANASDGLADILTHFEGGGCPGRGWDGVGRGGAEGVGMGGCDKSGWWPDPVRLQRTMDRRKPVTPALHLHTPRLPRTICQENIWRGLV